MSPGTTLRVCRPRVLAVAIACLPLAAAAVLSVPQAGASKVGDDHLPFSERGLRAAAAASGDAGNAGVRVPTDATRLISGLDNPRQLSRTGGGALVVAEAGHANPNNCGRDACVGFSGKVSLVKDGNKRVVMRRLISLAGPDGSFAVGPDGASKTPGGPFLAVETYVPPRLLPPGTDTKQLGKLLARKVPGGVTHIRANITAFERKHDPDGEGFDSNPYSVLGLKGQTLVADAAGDSILQLKGGKLRLWAELDPGPKLDAVPTVISKGGNGHIYVGTLWSEKPGAARVFEFTRTGRLLHVYRGFTGITGVAASRDGTLYVSELFSGCGFDQAPQCFPGRVVKANTGGDGRSHMRVPFPAGIVTAKGDSVRVAAWSIAPSSGFEGNPRYSGRILRLHF